MTLAFNAFEDPCPGLTMKQGEVHAAGCEGPLPWSHQQAGTVLQGARSGAVRQCRGCEVAGMRAGSRGSRRRGPADRGLRRAAEDEDGDAILSLALEVFHQECCCQYSTQSQQQFTRLEQIGFEVHAMDKGEHPARSSGH